MIFFPADCLACRRPFATLSDRYDVRSLPDPFVISPDRVSIVKMRLATLAFKAPLTQRVEL